MCIKFFPPSCLPPKSPSAAAFSGLALNNELERQALPFWCQILSNQNYFDEQAVGETVQ